MIGEGLIELFGFPALVIALLSIFWKGDDVLSEEARRDLGSWLNRASLPSSFRPLGSFVLALFERVFGRTHWSILCAFRSFLTSLILFLLVFSLSWQREYVGWGGLSLISSVSMLAFDPIFLCLILLINPVGDYLSLWVTRRRLLTLAAGEITVSYTIILDFITSILIFWIWANFITFVLFLIPYYFFGFKDNEFNGGPIEFLQATLLHFASNMPRQSNLSPEVWWSAANGIINAAVVTALVGSIWLWSAVLGAGAIRFASRMHGVIRFLKYSLNIAEKPVRSIGIVALLCILSAHAILWTGNQILLVM